MDKYYQNLSSSKHLIMLMERAGTGNLGKEDRIKKHDKAKKKKSICFSQFIHRSASWHILVFGSVKLSLGLSPYHWLFSKDKTEYSVNLFRFNRFCPPEIFEVLERGI